MSQSFRNHVSSLQPLTHPRSLVRAARVAAAHLCEATEDRTAAPEDAAKGIPNLSCWRLLGIARP